MVIKKPKASVIKASYRLMQKVGFGPVPLDVIQECEDFIRTNRIDFLPWALHCLHELNAALLDAIGKETLDDKLKHDMIAPIMQLKATGTMFQKAPLTELAGVLLHFLETIPSLSQDVLDIVNANEVVLKSFLRDNKGNEMTETKQQLIHELKLACNRYADRNHMPRIFKIEAKTPSPA